MQIPIRQTAACVLAASALFVSATATAQSILVPSSLGDGVTEGVTSTSYPWNRSTGQIRVQYVYDAINFTSSGIDSDMSIHTLRWRANGGNVASGGAFSSAVVRMSHASNPGSALDTTFANNYGADLSVVYDGPVTVQPASGGTPNDFYVEVSLDRDFFYSPGSGSGLLVEIELDGTASWSGTSTTTLDATSGDPDVGRVFSLTAGSTTGSTQSGVGVALGIGYERAVVVPSTVGGAPQAGNSSSSFPWNRANGMRVQYAYDASNFTSQFPSGVSDDAILIDRLRWRADGANTGGGVYGDVSVRLSTMDRDHQAVSVTFAENHGPDMATVFQGSVTVEPATAGPSVSDFFVTIEFAQPFLYRPDDGDLLVDLDVGPASSGTTFPLLDVVFGAGANCYRVFNTTGSQTLSGSVQADVGPAMEARFRRIKAPLVIPNANDLVEGNSSSRYPWGRDTSGMRVLYSYDESLFTNEGVTQPILIDRLRWRANGGSTGGTGVFPDARIRLSSGAVDHTALSATFDANHGPDVALVYQGSVAVTAVSGASPNDYYVDVALSQPFLYHPGVGADLMVDLSVDCSLWTGASSPPALDVEFGGSTPGTRLFSTTDRNAMTGSVQNDICAVLEVGYTNAKGLCTTFAGGNGLLGNGNSVYFDADVTAAGGINVNRLAIHTASTSTCDVEVYITPGSYVGNTSTAAAWTLFSTGQGLGAGLGGPTIIDLEDTLLPAGTWGIAVHYVNCDLRYTTGNGANQTYANGDLSLSLGTSQAGLFSGTTFAPRVWNGCIFYDTDGYYTFDGQGCLSSAGQFVTNTGVPGYAPGLGRTFVAQFENIPDVVGIMTLGFTNTSWAGQSLPVDLGPVLGLPGCTYYSEPFDTFFLLADGTGRATWSTTTPNNPVFAGARFYTQALIIDNSIGNALDAIVSDAAVGVVGF